MPDRDPAYQASHTSGIAIVRTANYLRHYPRPAKRGTDCQRCVDWAVGLLMEGRDDDYVCRLAGQLPPYDIDAISILRDRSLNELGFSDLSNGTLICYAIAQALLEASPNPEHLRETLHTARGLYVTDGIDDLYPLYLLSHGLDELDTFGDQWYVDGMGTSNVDQSTLRIVEAFVNRHREPP